MTSRAPTILLSIGATVLLGALCMPFDNILDYLDDVDQTVPVSTFDGEWLGVEFAYAMEIEDRVGSVTQSNSYAYQVGDPVLVILDVDGSRFSGKHMFTDGRARSVIGSLLDDDTLSLTGNGYSWQMKRFKVNLLPTTGNQFLTTPVNTPLSVTLTGDDPDDGPDPLSFSILTLPSNGQILGVSPTFTYTPTAAFIGNDQFTFSVSDGEDTAAGTVLIQVLAANQAPVVDAGIGQDIAYPIVTVQLDGSATDDGLPDGNIFYTWRLAGDSPSRESVDFSYANILNPTVTFSAAGVYRLELLADDGDLTALDTVTIGVSGTFPED